MTNPDDLLIDDLRAAASERPEVPPRLVRAAALAAFTWRTVDAELALLAYDSADEPALAGVRGGTGRILSFTGPTCTLDVEVFRADGERALAGEIVPAPRGLELEQSVLPQSRREVAVDDSGRFRVEGVVAGAVRFRVLVGGSAGPRIVTTDWVSI